jgi:glycine/D-amino acid oxidase-like deaminating enzyme
MTVQRQSDVLVIGGGLAGIVTALEALRAGQSVTWWTATRPSASAAWRCGPLAAWRWWARRCRRA